jgi:hypothetical protein
VATCDSTSGIGKMISGDECTLSCYNYCADNSCVNETTCTKCKDGYKKFYSYEYYDEQLALPGFNKTFIN